LNDPVSKSLWSFEHITYPFPTIVHIIIIELQGT